MTDEEFDELFNSPKQKEPTIDDLSETLSIEIALQKLRELMIITN